MKQLKMNLALAVAMAYEGLSTMSTPKLPGGFLSDQDGPQTRNLRDQQYKLSKAERKRERKAARRAKMASRSL